MNCFPPACLGRLRRLASVRWRSRGASLPYAKVQTWRALFGKSIQGCRTGAMQRRIETGVLRKCAPVAHFAQKEHSLIGIVCLVSLKRKFNIYALTGTRDISVS